MQTTIVEVEWVDAFSHSSGWHDIDELVELADQPLTVRSVGHLLKRTRTHLILATNRHADNRAADTMTIPLGCVRRVRKL